MSGTKRRCTGLGAFAIALCLSGPTAARAQAPALADGRISIDDARVHVLFETTVPVEEPRLSVERGALRLRFAEARGGRLDLAGDGGAIRFVRVRPGVGDAIVAVVRLGDMRELDEHSISIALEGTTVDVSIARAALPAVRGAPPLAPHLEPSVVEPAPAAPVAPETTEPHDYLREPPSLLLGADAEAPAPSAASPETLGVPEAERPSNTSLLLLLTAALGAALLVARWLGSRRKLAQGEPIRVLAAHRLSARHQLLLIRALGQDHLLSVDGARTERLFSQSAPTETDRVHTALAAALPEEPGLGVGRGEGASTGSHDFAARVLELVGERRDTVTLGTSPAGARPSAAPHAAGLTSDAVAGLLRLRTRAVR